MQANLMSFAILITNATLWLILSCALFVAPAKSEPLHLQLRWQHQFQFAGYYAAVEKGFYRNAGLDVIIHEGAPGLLPITEVLKGRAQYGVANSEVLLERLRGAPLVALAAIFQHSASILLARKDAHIETPEDLTGKKVMMMSQTVDADFIAMFNNEGIDPSRIQFLQNSYNIQDLIAGKVDAVNAYISNEPFILKQQDVDYLIVDPNTYGIDYYSDILFTTEAELLHHPERAKAFREASLQGWRYAMENPQEIIDILIKKYHVPKSRAHLDFEAEAMKNLILPDLIEIGHMNPWRWRQMAETFVKVEIVDNDDFLQGFSYDPGVAEDNEKQQYYLSIAAVIGLFPSLIAAALFYAYRVVKRENNLRLKAETDIRELAFKDALTGLDNRHHFFMLAEQVLKMAHRSHSKVAVLYIDLNNFKTINDCLGHKAGDDVLRQVGQGLRKFVRQSDIVARLGGDEFVLLLYGVAQADDLLRLLEKIHQELDYCVDYQGKHLHVTASIGSAMYPDDGLDIDTLLDKADSDMYGIKHDSKVEKIDKQVLSMSE